MFFRFGEKDTSWVDEVNDFIEELKPFPQEPIPTPLSMYQFYLNENGSSQLIYHSSSKSDDFVATIRGILNRAHRIINSSRSEEFLDEVLESTKFMQVIFRLGDDFWTDKNVLSAYFILEDNSGKDLEGAVIMYSYNSGEVEYSLREIV